MGFGIEMNEGGRDSFSGVLCSVGRILPQMASRRV